MIKTVVIKNYKGFRDFSFDLREGLNVIVGDNEAGKSTILEAINLCLTKRLHGRQIEFELSPHHVNVSATQEYIQNLHGCVATSPPSILIELYLADDAHLAHLSGTMNSRKENTPGIKLEISLDDDFADEYRELISRPENVLAVPTEYYRANWYSFANNPVSLKGLPTKVSFIDASTIRLQSGTDYYLQEIIRNELDAKQRAALSLAYRHLKESFAENASIKAINKHLTDQKGAISDKELSISFDISQRANWEGNLMPHLDQLPFQSVGKGEQNALKIMLALERKADDVSLLLIEEPENHLSYSSMNKLLRKIVEKCDGKQIIVTTHSGFVLNKLGLDRLILLANQKGTSFKNLPEETKSYFMKLPGYDTLRLILAKRAILVEGPSDELVVQRAYCDIHKVLPIENGVDVISVRGLSFRRFLDIGAQLSTQVSVVTDNDGDFKKNVDGKYTTYLQHQNIQVHRSEEDDLPTLEPQLLKSNGRDLLNEILGTAYLTDDDLLKFMAANKTECALRIFDSKKTLKMPKYIQDAVA